MGQDDSPELPAKDCFPEQASDSDYNPMPKARVSAIAVAREQEILFIPTVADNGYEEDWSEDRKRLGILLHSKGFDLARGLVILLNIFLLMLETDAEASEGKAPTWIWVMNVLLVVVYTVELAARLGTYRARFFDTWGNIFDMGIILADVLVEAVLTIGQEVEGLPSLVILRTFRLMRLGRTHKALYMFPELNIMVLGIRGALRTIFWGLILLSIVTISFAVLAVKMIHPLNLEVAMSGAYDDCERCPRAYESVFASSLTFTQQIIAGDSWGQVTIPVIEHSRMSGIFFITVLAVLGFMLLNLILAVVIDSANQARQETDHQRAEVKECAFREATESLVAICESLDSDRSGSLTLDELIEGYKTHKEFEDAMILLDIHQRDMSTVFSIMDEDQSGQVRYDEFVEQLYKMKSEDSHTMITFIKFYVQEIQREMKNELKATRQLLHEFHASVQQAIAHVPKDHQQGPSSSRQNNGTLTSSCELTDLLSKQADGSLQLLASAQFDWLKESQMQLKRLLDDMANDLRKNDSKLCSVLDRSLPLKSPCLNSMDQRAVTDTTLKQGIKPPGGTQSDVISQNKVASSLLVMPTSLMPGDSGGTPVTRPPPPGPPQLSDSQFRMSCCDASSSTAHPPVSII